MQKVNYTKKTPKLLQNEGIGPGGGGDDRVMKLLGLVTEAWVNTRDKMGHWHVTLCFTRKLTWQVLLGKRSRRTHLMRRAQDPGP